MTLYPFKSMRLLIFFLILLGLEYYGWRALHDVYRDSSSIATKGIKLFYIAGSIYSLGFILMLWTDFKFPPGSATFRYLGSFFMIWLISLLAYCSFLFIDDIRRLVVWAIGGLDPKDFLSSRSKFLYYAGAFAGLIPLVALTYGMLRNLYNFKKYKVEIPIANLPQAMEGLKIIQISDIHSGTFARVSAVEKIVEMINSENPDLILFTGDLVNEIAEEIEPFIPVFSQLKAKYGVYSVLGNHDYGDYYRGDRKIFSKQANLELLEKHQAAMGWKLLNNTNEIIDINGAKLGLIGMGNASSKHYFRNYGDINTAYPGVEDSDIKILMSHDPSYWREKVLNSFDDIALTLSGHTHGFQFGIEIPGFIKWSPAKYTYKEWAGLYSENKQHLYVNRGLGCLGYPGRVGILPEISILQLTKSV